MAHRYPHRGPPAPYRQAYMAIEAHKGLARVEDSGIIVKE